MENFLLFKQAVSLILLFETLLLWPKCELYFGPPVFAKSIFRKPLVIHAFQALLSLSLIFLFLDCWSVLASFILLLCMRYLYVTSAKERLATYGAVGHVCYFVSAYLFFFEFSFLIDPQMRLAHFLHSIFAIEVGLMLCMSGIYKFVYGYTKGRGFEYGLVNPSWGKLFFLFKKLKPSSKFFTFSNYGAIISELLIGLLFLIPQTRPYGAYLLLLLFFYLFFVVRVNILALLMMSIALFFIHPIAFHFPAVGLHFPPTSAPEPVIMLIEALFILYLVIHIAISIFRVVQVTKQVSPPPFLDVPMKRFIALRPYFEWNVFIYAFTHYYIDIRKVSKATRMVTGTIYDGFSKHYREIFDDPGLFLRFSHHHESSLLLHIFTAPLYLPKEEMQKHMSTFTSQMKMYAKTLLPESEQKDTFLIFTVMDIRKEDDCFVSVPIMQFSVVDEKYP